MATRVEDAVKPLQDKIDVATRPLEAKIDALQRRMVQQTVILTIVGLLVTVAVAFAPVLAALAHQ